MQKKLMTWLEVVGLVMFAATTAGATRHHHIRAQHHHVHHIRHRHFRHPRLHHHRRHHPVALATANPNEPVPSAIPHKKPDLINISQKTTSLHMVAPDLNQNVLRLALKAYNHAEQQGKVQRPYMTVIDYSRDSNQKRLWVFDLVHDSMPFHTYVSHGKNTGDLHAHSFSNQPRSLESSLGVFITQHTYIGHKGYSLRINGLEHGYNDNALSRDIVIHGAWYATENFLANHGLLGRSWGCPALPVGVATPIINTIKDGSLVFAYYPDHGWLNHSAYLT